MKSRSMFALAGASAVVVFTQVASAHPGHGTATGLSAGISHPFSGIDHLLAMIAVGLCAARIGGRALWLLPATFIAFMIGGGLLGMSGVHVPAVEQTIAASVLVLGLIMATGSALRIPLMAGLVALFALFHGYAHGAEMQAGALPVAYVAGFVAATALLHAAGIVAGKSMQRAGRVTLARVAGLAIALCGVALFTI